MSLKCTVVTDYIWIEKLKNLILYFLAFLVSLIAVLNAFSFETIFCNSFYLFIKCSYIINTIFKCQTLRSLRYMEMALVKSFMEFLIKMMDFDEIGMMTLDIFFNFN